MTSARKHLVELLSVEDPFTFERSYLEPLQLAAAQEMFSERRARIPVLDNLAKEAGISEVRQLSDLVPLLLSHTTYKSYPQSFIQKGQWDRLSMWLGMVSARRYEDVDVKGVRDIDEWIDRMWKADCYVVSSSGTGGKVALFPKSKSDQDRFREVVRRFRGWPNSVKPERKHHFFLFGSMKGPYSAAVAAGYAAEAFGRPDSTHVLMDEPVLISKVSRMAEMRQKMKDGTATPGELAAFEAEANARSKESQRRMDEMVERLINVRKEPVYVMGTAAQVYEIVERGRALGVAEGEFHPDSFVMTTGGTKHFKLPEDYRTQISRFFWRARSGAGYGMTEMSCSYPRCEAGRYHANPFTVPLLLDETGTELLNAPDGIVEGRFAFLDLATDLRWGGLITADKVKVDFSGKCGCGRKSIGVLDPILRYDEGVGSDKIQCSGTIDAYIRGSFAD